MWPDNSKLKTIAYTELSTLPVGPIGSKIYIRDVGEYGAEYISNGVSYVHSGEIEIIQKAKGWISPSLAAANAATYSQTGTIITVTSIGHNIPATSYDSKDVYLNMGTAATGVTIPPGWFSNFQRTGADTFTCVSTVSQTGTGAVNTNLNVTIIPDLASTIIGGSLGLNGVLKYSLIGSNNNSAGSKTIRFNYGSSGEFSYGTQTTTGIFTSLTDIIIANRNSNTSKLTNINGSSVVVFNLDTSVNQACTFSLDLSAANDYLAIHSASLYINPS